LVWATRKEHLIIDEQDARMTRKGSKTASEFDNNIMKSREEHRAAEASGPRSIGRARLQAMTTIINPSRR
jgi:hypothetical protein